MWLSAKVDTRVNTSGLHDFDIEEYTLFNADYLLPKIDADEMYARCCCDDILCRGGGPCSCGGSFPAMAELADVHWDASRFRRGGIMRVMSALSELSF